MKNSTATAFPPFKKAKSVFCLFEDLISKRILNLKFSGQNIIKLRPELLENIFHVYNTRLFSEFMTQPSHGRIKLAKWHESLEDLSQIVKIDPSEIEMGELGNSLFISAICALVETPILIFSLMDQVNSTTYGQIYFVFINQNGTWRELCLDGQLPYRIETVPDEKLLSSNKKASKKDPIKEKEKKTLLFSRLKNKDQNWNWLGLLEKAYAFAYGSYNKMLDCLLEDILYDLTGTSIETLSIKQMSNFELGDLLLKNFNKGSPMLLLENDLTDRLNELYQRQKTFNQWAMPIIDLRNTNTEYIIVKIRALKPLKKKKTHI